MVHILLTDTVFFLVQTNRCRCRGVARRNHAEESNLLRSKYYLENGIGNERRGKLPRLWAIFPDLSGPHMSTDSIDTAAPPFAQRIMSMIHKRERSGRLRTRQPCGCHHAGRTEARDRGETLLLLTVTTPAYGTL